MLKKEGMQFVFKCLEKGINVLNYINDFNSDQIYEIYLGLKQGLDVSIYDKLEFNEFQMEQIRLGLEKGLNVSIYSKPEFDFMQMYEIRIGLKEGLDISNYANPKYNWKQMEIKRKIIEVG